MSIESRLHPPSHDEAGDDGSASTEGPTNRLYRWVEVLSAAMLALATIATAWSGYQSALWNSEQIRQRGRATTAEITSLQFTNLAEQKIGLHASLFGQWAAAIATNNTALADFLFNRFPEPLKRATVAWRATQPLTNPAAPATPFDMAEYELVENSEVQRWEDIATAAYAASDQSGEIADGYLLFTIIFASVLFFGGISGKFRWQVLDVAVLVMGALVLLIGVAILASSPIK